MRTSSSMTRARHTFFLTSESSSRARANRLCAQVANLDLDGTDTGCLTTESATHLNESVNVFHQSLGPAYDELVNTGDGMRPARECLWQSLKTTKK